MKLLSVFNRVSPWPMKVVLALALVAPAHAQWFDIKTPNIPRLPDGKPNLNAPVPKTADNKPDLSGVWRVSRPYDPTRAPAADKDIPFLPWAKVEAERRRENLGKDNPEARCLPYTAATSGILMNGLFKIVQTPNLIVILYEEYTYFRQIFLDGRSLPSQPNPAWLGYSVGRWEGDTLVIETTGNNGIAWLPASRPATTSLHITERYRRADFGHLERLYTIKDPGAYTKPWSYHANADLLPDDELIENICIENERDFAHLVGK